MQPEPLKVLLVEDNPGDARLIREMLAEAGGGAFEMEWVPQLSDALKRLAGGEISLVLLDLGLPDSNGLGTFTRAYARAPHTPFVVLTGLADETLAVTAVRHGAQDYLVKGQVDGAALLRALRYAAERKRMEEALKDSEKNLRYLASQLLTAQEQERKRISRELHDDLGQSLLVMKLQLDSAEKQLEPDLHRELMAQLKRTIDSVRRLSRDLSPAILEDLGLSAAVRNLASEFEQHYNLDRCIIATDKVDDLFSPDAQVNLYRIFQECLTNIGKYAKAKRISIEIKREPGRVCFKVEDNGRGFNLEQVIKRGSRERGLGLAAMEERVRMLGGSLTIWSKEGVGTRITFVVPVAKKAKPSCLQIVSS